MEVDFSELERNIKVYTRLQLRTLTWGKFQENCAVEITRKKVDLPPEKGGPATLANLTVFKDGRIRFSAGFPPKVLSCVSCINPDGSLNWETVETQLQKLGTSFVACGGISCEQFDKEFSSLTEAPQNMQKVFECYHSTKCMVWCRLRDRATEDERQLVADFEFKCPNCNEALRGARKKDRAKAALSPSKKNSRVQANSRVPIAKLTPKSTTLRAQNLAKARQKDYHRIKRLEEQLEGSEVDVDEEQSEELSTFLKHVSSKDVDKAIDEVAEEDPDVGHAIRWEKDQKRNRDGCNGNRWSMVTYRIALSMYCRSPATYDTLRSWGIFRLPTRSSLKQYTSALLQDPGVDFDFLKDQALRYSSFKEELANENKPVPNGEGVLILDEVKVAGKMAWNSKNGKMYGLAMDSSDFISLKDVVSDVNTPKPAEFVLQFLWRDLSSKYDVIGPHYTSDKSMNTKFTITCLMDTLHAFQVMNFKVASIVCDGASINLAMIKYLSGAPKGAYGLHGPPEDPHEVKPWFPNPQFPGSNIYFVVCPTHQLKNMVNQLFASQPGSPKEFRYGRKTDTFGWVQIQGMWEREKEKRDTLQTRLVPNLIWAYIERDAWTKLNVKPAKIMQQNQVLAELYSYANPDGRAKPGDARVVMATYQYLEACSKLFEFGFLNTDPTCKIRDVNNSVILSNISEGFSFFKAWVDKLRRQCPDFKQTSPTESRFISWQTYDLLRVCAYSFPAFSREYLARNPDNYLVPMKINGSAIETLFSQFKYAAGSKLTSVNYETAKRSVMLKRNVQGPSVAKGYRDEHLYVQDIPLQKKKRV